MYEVTRGAIEAMAAHAATRHGAIGIGEAMELGMTRSGVRAALARGDWTRPIRGVLVSTAAPTTWLQRAAIAVIASGGVLSHRAAARLHRLDGFQESAVEVSVPWTCSWTHPDVIVHRVRPMERPDVYEVDGIAVTSVARTLVDLGAVVGEDMVEQALDDALRRGTSERWIEGTLQRVARPGLSGSGVLRRVLARPHRRGPLPDSVFERLVERVCIDAGLPAPERQIEVRDDGRLVAIVDVGWPGPKLGIEGHSKRWHAGALRGDEDRVRDNRLTALGWELLYASWRDTLHPEALTRDARQAYSRRSG